MKRLTEKQGKVLGFIRSFLAEEDRHPSTREMAEEFGWASQTAAYCYLRSLERKGYLERRGMPGKVRGWYRLRRVSTDL